MQSRSYSAFLGLAFVAALIGDGAVLTPPLRAAEGLAVGACVSVKGQPGRIITLTPGGYVVQGEGKAASQALNWARSDVEPGPCPRPPTQAQLAQPHKCFPSDADSRGASALERTYRGVIRKTFAHAADPGMDGAVTIDFQSFKIGAPRHWLISDGYNFASDHSKPIRELRVVFTTCTDFRTAIQLVQMERNFECFTAPTGETVCQISGSTGGMMRDKKQYIPKA
jgi:hypothetical protein